jgi:hypothetical protein
MPIEVNSAAANQDSHGMKSGRLASAPGLAGSQIKLSLTEQFNYSLETEGEISRRKIFFGRVMFLCFLANCLVEAMPMG